MINMDEKLPLRKNVPVRSCTKVYSNYRSYKKYLMYDFNRRCGYCDDFDGWTGGPNTYHIDHFAPKSKFKELENDYNNLVYSCPFCNRFKSDDWPSEEDTVIDESNVGYVDPCNKEYNEHFFRDKYGNIKPDSKVGIYMHEKLKLYLSRHRVIWNLTRIKELKDKLRSHLDSENVNVEKIRSNYLDLCLEFDRYLDYLLGDISKYD